MSPSPPTDRARVQIRRARSFGSAIRPPRLSIITKSFPPPAIFEKGSGSCLPDCTCPAGFIGIFDLPPPFSHGRGRAHAEPKRAVARLKRRSLSGGTRLNRILTLLIVAALTLPAIAQRQPAQSEPPLPAISENIDVRVIDFDVVVTDRRGNFVPGLTKDDFEIFENNVPKPVTNFYEVSGGVPKNVVASEVGGQLPAPTPTPAAPGVNREEMKRRIIIYIDNLSLAPFNRNRVFSSMKDFLKTTMRPGDEAMVATYNRSMKVRVPFTRDVNQVTSILDAISSESALGVNNRSERKSFEDRIRDATSYDDAIASARTYASSVEHDLRQGVSSLNALLSTLAGVEGKKILVLTSEGFPMQPGREIVTYVDEVARE